MKSTIILFGSTGDLAKRKLFRAFYNLYIKKHDIEIISIGRRDWTREDFLKYFKDEISHFIGDVDSGFLDNLNYFKLDLTNLDDYSLLYEEIKSRESIVYYLSIGAEYFNYVITGVGDFNIKNSKIVFEKPFGHDLNSAIELNEHISKYFDETNIYRIDHYLGKNSVGNILNFRFSNTIFKGLWHTDYIDNIQITSLETLGIEQRGDFYDKTGALRDMIQNHLFQLLSLVAMDEPTTMSPDDIHRAKSRVLDKISISSDFSNIVFGKYDGYTSESGVDPNSNTETFVAMKLHLESGNLEGVPIYLKTGKKLSHKSTKIVIEFKDSSGLFNLGDISKNRIIIDIYPTESISIEFNISSEDDHIEKVISKFDRDISKIDAYERLIDDIVTGDKTLFPTFDIIKKSWAIVDDLVNCKDNCPLPFTYKPLSNGPSAADDLLLDEGRSWY